MRGGASRDGRLRLAVVVLNYRTPELVIDCLASLVPELDPARDAALVVDNASGDGSAEQIEAAVAARGWGDRVRVLRSERNGGFSAGNNLGLAAADADFHLLLNSDTQLRPGAVGELLAAAAANPAAGLVGPRLEWPDGSSQHSAFRFRAPLGELLEAASIGPLSRLLRRWDVLLDPGDAPCDADWLSFACVLIRREALAAVGPMDEGFFMYFEDVDYCRRAGAQGWRRLYWPAARVVHLIGGTSPVQAALDRRGRPPAYFYAARARYFAKWYGRAGLWAANLLWLAGRAASALRESLGGPQAPVCEGAARDIWRNAARPLSPGETSA